MVALLAIIVPVILFIYLFLKARKTIAGFVALFLFPTFGQNAYIAFDFLGGRIKFIDIAFLSILILWILMIARRKGSNKIRLDSNGIITLFMVILVIIHIIYGFIEGFPNSILPLTYRPFLYFVIGLFFWVDILRRLTRNQFWELLNILSVATVFLSVLYILSALGTEVYPYSLYQETNYSGSTIVRDFNTIPVYIFPAIIFSTIRSGLKPKWIVGLFILILSVFFMFTRVYLLQAVSILALGFGWSILKSKRKFSQIIKYAILFIGIFMIILVIKNYWGVYFDFFYNRIEELLLYGGDTQNLSYRLELNTMAIRSIYENNHILTGFGIQEYASLDLASRYRWLGDSASAWIFYFYGLLGMILIFFQMVVNGFNSVKMIFSNNFIKSQIGAFFFIYIFIFIITIVSLTYIFDGVMGGLVIAAIYVEKNNYWYGESMEQSCKY